MLLRQMFLKHKLIRKKAKKTVEERAIEYAKRIEDAETLGEIWAIEKEVKDWCQTLSKKDWDRADKALNKYLNKR